MVNILGVSALFHDSAAALLIDGELKAASQEERFSRSKSDGGIPWRAVRACLDAAGLNITDIDCLAYYEDPGSKADRQLSMLATESRTDITKRIVAGIDPVWPYRALRESLGFDGQIQCIPHHMSHAASAFYYSGFDAAAVLVVDAVGEWSTSSMGYATADTGIRLRETDRFPNSLGLFYSTVTSYIGFEVNDGEYKTMGLAPLGRPRFVEQLRRLIDYDDNGAIGLDLRYFDFAGFKRMWSDRFADLIGRPPRQRAEELDDWHADLACSAQLILEQIMLRKARHAQELTGAKNLCMAGGVALNCVATAALRNAELFQDIFVQPAAGDAGGAIGAAAQASFSLGSPPPRERLAHVYLGPEFSAGRDVAAALKATGFHYSDYQGREDELLDDTAARLASGQIIGWFQGRMEFGPRALGARSILADPRLPDMRDRINGLVKMRESFRPFAPSVLEQYAAEVFDCPATLPFMLETVRTRVDWLPAVTHVDGSARVQIVDANANHRYARLIERFRSRTGCPVLLNTSFNQRGEPIVCSPGDALACFVRSGLDALVIEDMVVDKRDVPESVFSRAPAHRAPGQELAVYRLV